jgi:hypothetical protein
VRQSAQGLEALEEKIWWGQGDEEVGREMVGEDGEEEVGENEKSCDFQESSSLVQDPLLRVSVLSSPF